MTFKEHLDVVVALAAAAAIILMDADVSKAREVLTPLIALHPRIAILKIESRQYHKEELRQLFPYQKSQVHQMNIAAG